MRNRTKPFFFIGVLVVLLMFLIGFRSGQQVERRNEEVDFILSLTPEPTATPTITPTLPSVQYKTYLHTRCGAQFVIPSTLKKTKETSDSARFEENDTVKLALSCARTDPFTKALAEDKSATGVARLNPSTGRRTYFFLSKDLLPLLSSTLEFTTDNP